MTLSGSGLLDQTAPPAPPVSKLCIALQPATIPGMNPDPDYSPDHEDPRFEPRYDAMWRPDVTPEEDAIDAMWTPEEA